MDEFAEVESIEREIEELLARAARKHFSGEADDDELASVATLSHRLTELTAPRIPA